MGGKPGKRQRCNIRNRGSGGGGERFLLLFPASRQLILISRKIISNVPSYGQHRSKEDLRKGEEKKKEWKEFLSYTSKRNSGTNEGTEGPPLTKKGGTPVLRRVPREEEISGNSSNHSQTERVFVPSLSLSLRKLSFLSQEVCEMNIDFEQ